MPEAAVSHLFLEKIKKLPNNRKSLMMEATPRFELGNKGFADLCLTTWLCRHIHLNRTVS